MLLVLLLLDIEARARPLEEVVPPRVLGRRMELGRWPSGAETGLSSAKPGYGQRQAEEAGFAVIRAEDLLQDVAPRDGE
jgi:hypothetical protein